MSDDRGDAAAGDPWRRLIRWLEEQKVDLAGRAMTGTLTLPEYALCCGGHIAVQQVLDRVEMIRKNEDIRPPAPRRAWSVEE